MAKRGHRSGPQASEGEAQHGLSQLVSLSPGNRWLLFTLLLPTATGIALGDVIVDAFTVEKG
jgi:hypothetical protein